MSGSFNRALFGRVAWWLVVATLALLPWEYRLPQVAVGRFTVTTLEAVWLAALACWVVGLIVERRRPAVPRLVSVGLAIMLVANVLSALLADGYNEDALVFIGRSAAGWLLFVAVADLVRNTDSLRTCLRAVVAGAALSAVLGIALLAVPGLPEVLGIDRFFTAGAPRLTGSFDYPNTAAMAFEGSALLGVSLIALERRRWLIWLEAAAIFIIVAAMILTLSRAAVIGAAAGLAAIGLLAWFSSRRRLGAAVFASAAALVVVALVVEISVAPIERLFTDAERGLYAAEYDAPATATLNAGSAEVTVTVTNTGSLTWNADGGATYALGFHWLAPDTSDVLGDGGRTIALGTVAPGATTTVSVPITVPDQTREYEVGWDIVRRNVTWFAQDGVPVATTKLGTDLPLAPPSSPGSNSVQLSGEDLTPTRADLWAVALQMVAERPILGVGPGTYRLRETAYRHLPQGSASTHSNSMYLELASTTGLVGLAAFLLVVGAALARLVAIVWRPSIADAQAIPASTVTWLTLAGVVAAIAAFLAHGFLDYFLAFNPTSGLWWATLGLAIAAPAALGVVRARHTALSPTPS